MAAAFGTKAGRHPSLLGGVHGGQGGAAWARNGAAGVAQQTQDAAVEGLARGVTAVKGAATLTAAAVGAGALGGAMDSESRCGRWGVSNHKRMNRSEFGRGMSSNRGGGSVASF
ncbi:hypothetical protein MRX96_033918 [Rhipicephalus microplus]